VGKVRIVTDSNASISKEVLEQYPIEVIPHVIRIGRDRHEETADLSVDRLFQLLREKQQSTGHAAMPELEAPNINRILDCYQRVGRETDEIVSIHMSSHLSPMWMQSRRAAEMMMGRYRIRVIDSLSTSLGLGVLVELAARAAADGANIHEVARLINGAVPHLYVTFFAETLNYLERSAQLGAAQSVLGTMLGIKAMLTMEDGKLIPLEKVQSREEVVEKLYAFVTEFAHIEQVGIVQHRYEQTQELFTERLGETLPRITTRLLHYPPSLATHLGPSVMGVVVYEGII
jgi:DegV family protein with EDD domain